MKPRAHSDQNGDRLRSTMKPFRLMRRNTGDTLATLERNQIQTLSIHKKATMNDKITLGLRATAAVFSLFIIQSCRPEKQEPGAPKSEVKIQKKEHIKPGQTLEEATALYGAPVLVFEEDYYFLEPSYGPNESPVMAGKVKVTVHDGKVTNVIVHQTSEQFR